MRRWLAAGVTLGLLCAYGQQSTRVPVTPAVAEFSHFLATHQAQLEATASQSPAVTVEYPHEGSLFPADIVPPLFQWIDTSPDAAVWRVEVDFGERGPRIRQWLSGEKMQLGPIDNSLVGTAHADAGTDCVAYLATRRENVGGDQKAFAEKAGHRALQRLQEQR
jgi:hypothetical protein